MAHASLERPRNLAAWALVLMASLLAVSAKAEERYWPPIVDPPTGQHHPGRFVWVDLVTSDVAAAAGFYGAVFGWTFETYGGEDDRDTYTLALADGLPIGGMVYDQRAKQGKKLSARWVGLISVTDLKAATSAVTQGGGKVVYQPVMLGERGETAIYQDPEGVVFGLVNSKSGDPPDFAGDVNEWYWIDLWSADVEKAAQFYRAVVGYETVPIADDGPRSGVRLVSGGFARGGIMAKDSKETSATWLPYIRVADVKATAARTTAAGGKVLLQPMALNLATVAIIADPTGAPVGIVQVPATEAQP
ncbi:MAG: VOC family protein [Gammaproteobacteria bacterium]|nr:VOC family protein [Gammaproteobacteria bacterium]MDH4312741.1 VOC family protein [Gammaproteobacteria bacterium]MDH5274009.1 VOC family protein [Gammaproteobacteria bacterium]